MKKISMVLGVLLLTICFAMPAFAFGDSTATATAGASAYAGSAAVLEGGVNVNPVQGQYIDNRSYGAEQKDLTTVRNEGSGYRGFPIGPQMTYPGFPTYFNGATDGASVTKLEDFLMYGNTWDIATLEAMASSSEFLGLSSGYKVITVAECPEGAQPTAVKALLKSQVKGVYKRVATITVKATTLNTTSEKLLAAAALEGSKYGASEIHIIDAGKHRVMTGEGWGIGLYYYAAGLSASESSGQMGGGGTGYSTGESGYQDKPWVKVIAVIPAK